MRSNNIQVVTQFFKEAWELFRVKWLILAPFAILAGASSFLAPMYNAMFPLTTGQNIGYLVVSSLGITLSFMFNICLFLQVNAYFNKEEKSYREIFFTGFVKTPKVILGYLGMLFVILLGLLVSSSVVGSIGDLVFRICFAIFFALILFSLYVRVCFYYQNILLRNDSVWRAFVNSFNSMRIQENRRLTMICLCSIPLFYLVFIILPLGIMGLLAWQAGYFNTLDINLLTQALTVMQSKQTLPALMQEQIQAFMYILQVFSIIFTVFATLFKPFIYAILLLLFKYIYKDECTKDTELESIVI